MRIRFPDGSLAKEKNAQKATLRAIDAWWKAFAAKAKDLDALFTSKKKWDLPAFMKQKLGPVDKRLMWEFGPAVGKKNKHRLVITVESELALSPLRDLVLARAPKVPGFEFYPHRVAEPLRMLAPTLEGRLQCAVPDMSVVVTSGEHGTVDLLFLIAGCKSAEDADAHAVAFITSETLLGEEILMRDIGTIQVSPPKKVRGAVALSAFRVAVTKLLKKRDAARPKKPASAGADAATYSLFKLEPQPDQFGGQRDLVVGLTRRPDVFGATHSDLPFFSETFSRHGEVFAYLKIDGAKGLAGSVWDDREEIENAISAVLGAKLGAVIGGGTGARYSYIELALRDVEATIPRVCKVLRDGKIPKRTWLLFHDAGLVDEWVAIHPGAPAPPR